MGPERPVRHLKAVLAAASHGEFRAVRDVLDPEVAAAHCADSTKGFAEKFDFDRAHGSAWALTVTRT